MAQVLETATGKGFLSDADDDALEAVTRFLQGIEGTCSDECSLDKSQVKELQNLASLSMLLNVPAECFLNWKHSVQY